MDRSAELVAAVGAVRLCLRAVLQVADELVALVELVGQLAGIVAQLGVEGRAVEERARGRGGDRVPLVEERAKRPHPVTQQRAADADVGVLVAGEAVAVRTDGRADRGCDLVGRQIAALQALVLHVVVDAEAGRVAAALAHKLGEHAGVRHLGRVGRGADEHFFERTVVEVEAGGRRALGGVDALDQRAVLPRVAVGEVGGLGAHGGAADVDAVERDRGRRGQQRPHVAGVGYRRQLVLVVVGLQAGRRRVDDRRFAADHQRFVERRHRQGHVDLGVEAEGDAHAVALHGAEARQLVGECVFAGRHRGKAVDTGLVRHRAEGADLRRTGGRDGHARQHAALGVFHFT